MPDGVSISVTLRPRAHAQVRLLERDVARRTCDTWLYRLDIEYSVTPLADD